MTSVGITEIRSWERGPEFTFILGAADKTLAGIRCVYVRCQQGPGRESDGSELCFRKTVCCQAGLHPGPCNDLVHSLPASPLPVE